jgi:glutamine synthetase
MPVSGQNPVLVSESMLQPTQVLLREIRKPAADWTAADVASFARERRIRLLALMHVGGDGWLKTLDFVPRDPAHLADVLAGGERADGSSLFGDLGIPAAASDIVLRPRLSTAFVDPFAPEPTLAVLCGHHDRQGAPLPESPDTLVRAAYARLRAETGVDLHAHAEIEFFLGARLADADAYGSSERGYHATSPFVFGEGLRRRALVHLAEIGVPVKYGHAEVGYVEADESDPRSWEQHEIELWLRPLPEAADGVLLAQWVLRNLAQRAGMLCSFGPMVRKGHAGSGMHFHFAPFAGGKYLPHTSPDHALVGHARWLIAGLVEHGAALMAFGNRSADSFVRLGQGREAPTTLTWGHYDRRALVRIPVVPIDEHGRSTSPPTIEFRLPDGSAHPHLLLAAVAQAFVAGHAMTDANGALERAAVAAEGKASGTRVPMTFVEIADALARSRGVLEAGGVFTPHLLDRTIGLLRS